MEKDQTYQGKIVEADYAEAGTGTESLQIGIDIGEEKPVYYDLWLTPGNKERVEKTLAEFGLKAKDAEFWADPLEKLRDQPCSIVTDWDEKYKRVKIKWFNGPFRVPGGGKKSTTAKGARAAAGLFGFSVASDDPDNVPF